MLWSSGLRVPGKPLTKGSPDHRSIASPPGETSRPVPTINRRKYLRLNLPVLLVLAFAALSGSAQVIPALRMGPNISAFTTFTDAKPNYQYYGDAAVYGVSAGGILQTPHLPGIEVRGSLLRLGGLEHQESALAGPHVALHFGRIAPYLSVLGGYGNAWWFSHPPANHLLPPGKLMEGLGPEWSVLGGVDVHLYRHFNLRFGELGYSKIYVKDRTLTSLTASSGVVFRFH